MSGNPGQLKVQMVQSEVELTPRPSDELLNSEKLKQFALFSGLKNPISVEKLPGSIVLRKYAIGEVICQQGSGGGTAFYIPTQEDMIRLRALKDGRDPQTEIAKLSPVRDRQILTARILPGTVTAKRKGFWKSLFSAKQKARPGTRLAAIPNDGPSDIDFKTREAPLMEGEVFGEMSCMTFAPRSATVIAHQDCYLIEFNRNIFDQLQKDQKYRERNDTVYKERVLDNHLRRLDLFRNLTDAQMQFLRSGVTLELVDPGTVICEQGEKAGEDPLDVFLIRSGVVQVAVNVVLSLGKRDVDWQQFCLKVIEAGATPPAEAVAPQVQKGVARIVPPVKPAPAADAKSPAPGPGAKLGPADILAKARAAKGAAAPAAKPQLAENFSPAAEPAAHPSGDAAAEGPAKKPSVQDILAAARKKKAEAGSDAAPAAPPAAETTPTEAPAKKPSVSDILAAARKAKAAPAAEAPPPEQTPAEAPVAEATPAPAQKPSVADIIAAAKKGKAAPAAEVPPPEQTPVEVPVVEATPAPAKKPSVAEILAAARQGKASPPAEAPQEKATAAPAHKPSVADIIAAAKKAKAGPAAEATPPEPPPVEAPAAEVTAAPAKKPSVADILAAARQGKASPPAEAPQEKATAAPAHKPSVADIIAAAKKGKAGPAAEATPPEPPPVEAPVAEVTAVPAKKPSVADILAAARQGKASPPAEAPQEKNTAAPVHKPSVADIIAAAKKGKAAPAAEASSVEQSVAQVPEADVATAPAKKPSVAEVLAAARRAQQARFANGEDVNPVAAAPSSQEKSASEEDDEVEFSPTADLLGDRPAATPSTPVPPATVPQPQLASKIAAVKVPDAPVAAPAAKAPAAAAEEAPPVLRAAFPKKATTPEQLIWELMNDHVQAACRVVADRAEGYREKRMLVREALNAIIRNREFLASKPLEPALQHRTLQERICTFPNGTKGIKDAWSEPDVRMAGRSVLAHLFPSIVRGPGETGGPPRIVAYLTRGDYFGEVAVVMNEPRQASCIAYDHPVGESKRRPGRVELVRISGKVFKALLKESPELLAEARKRAEERRGSRYVTKPPTGLAATVSSPEFQNLGLFQGSRLLLIDLDRCTRCGECVKACVETHDDGYTRLFLDGPRFDRFLIPSACRSCLNPSCMIGCPVGAINRGDNGQIEIQDWCIGCALCAEQCPYDSIQMHDLGLIQEQSLGWSFTSSQMAAPNWQSRKSRRDRWGTGMSPFYWTPSFFSGLNDLKPKGICLRHEFDVGSSKRNRVQRYKLDMNSSLKDGKIWLNGKELAVNQELKKGTYVYTALIEAEQLKQKNNLLAVQLNLDEKEPPHREMVFSLRLDAIPEGGTRAKEVLEGGQAEFKLVTQRAAVCDLCSELPGKQPACVSSCPHDAAIRTNPLVNFPL